MSGAGGLGGAGGRGGGHWEQPQVGTEPLLSWEGHPTWPDSQGDLRCLPHGVPAAAGPGPPALHLSWDRPGAASGCSLLGRGAVDLNSLESANCTGDRVGDPTPGSASPPKLHRGSPSCNR